MKHYDPKKFVPEASRAAAAEATDRSFRLWPRCSVVWRSWPCWSSVAADGRQSRGWKVLSSPPVPRRSIRTSKEVQHRDGGIVKTLAIRQGDLVKEGQVLATLDDVQVKAELLIVRSQLGEAMGRQARLIART